MSMLTVKEIKKHFKIRNLLLRAVDGVNLQILNEETLGLVGESGCGKTTLGKVVLRLIEPTSGTVNFMGQDIFKLSKGDLKKLRREMQIIFQNPFASLNPRKTLYQTLSQPYLIHEPNKKDQIIKKVLKLLDDVGLSPAEMYLDKYPHELSGGQRQRIGVARAIALRPKFIVADEPVSSLDISIQTQILNLMKKLQKEYKIAYLFITHDLAVIRSISDRIAVMYLGKIVELARTQEFYTNPLHPYTKALLLSIPRPNPKLRRRSRIILKGDIPSPINPPKGCRFHTRCPRKRPKCAEVEPIFIEVENNHFVACHKII